jgi:hypothetical protein
VNVLLHVLRVLRGERAHTTIIHQSSKSTVIAKATTEDRRFEGFLTSHAYGHVLAEIANVTWSSSPEKLQHQRHQPRGQ